ncbi:MAG: S-layer homology domain-containing protein, partial [Deltaproteobacteria bacterium]|nr:S-layer homology domain-containing protein [Deltaproteobacteria bacterium]
TSVTEAPFPDVAQDLWFAKYVAANKQEAVIRGFLDGEFKPANQLTRAESATFINRAMSKVMP